MQQSISVPQGQRRLLPWLIVPTLACLTMAVLVILPSIDIRVPGETVARLGNFPHFVIIIVAAVLAIGVGLLMGEAGRRRADARVLLLSLGVLNAATAALLHALATPNILAAGPGIGFVVATPVGLVIASVFVFASALELRPAQARRVVAWQELLRSGSLAFWAVFALLALLRLPPFVGADPEALELPLFYCLVGQVVAPGIQWSATIAMLASAGLYGYAAARYLGRFRRQPTIVLAALLGGCVMLAVTTLNVGLGDTWHLSWWQWHLLLLVAFGMMAFGVFRQYRSEGSSRPIFDSLYMEETIQRIRQEYSGALEALVVRIQRQAEGRDEAGQAPLGGEVARQFGLSEGQAAVLERAAEALAHEREQIERLGALVAIGQESSVIQDELHLLQRSLGLTGAAFRDDQFQIGLMQDGQLNFGPDLRSGAQPDALVATVRERLIDQALREHRPAEQGAHLVLPLTVKDVPAGVLEVRRLRGGFAERDRWLLRTLASQLSVSLENTRLYQQIDQLFRQYMPASVATALIADPAQAALGGAVREISVLFGDLRGFTTLSERLSPPDLVNLLNRYYGVAAQAVLAEGGTIDKFMGDAMMAIFNAPATQADHALRACRAALAMQRVIAPIAAEASDMPRFGIGVNTGEALVGNIGSEAIRNFTAIGDTVNLASRLQTRAEGGQVLINSSTYALVKEHVQVQPLGQIQVKGKAVPVEVFLLLNVTP
jgi:class 3 adenylate cyclase